MNKEAVKKQLDITLSNLIEVKTDARAYLDCVNKGDEEDTGRALVRLGIETRLTCLMAQPYAGDQPSYRHAKQVLAQLDANVKDEEAKVQPDAIRELIQDADDLIEALTAKLREVEK